MWKWPLLEAAVLYLLTNILLWEIVLCKVILEFTWSYINYRGNCSLCHIETSQLISNLYQLSGFNMITEIYDYDYNFHWTLFSKRIYLFGASFSNIHQKFINLIFRVSSFFDNGPLLRRYQKPSSDITKARSHVTRLDI